MHSHRPRLRLRLRSHGTAWTCTEVEPGAPASRARATATARSSPADLCGKLTDNQVESTRHAYCTRSLIRYRTINDKREETGHALVMVVAASRLSSSAGDHPSPGGDPYGVRLPGAH
ncbi:hypothetical protein GCM10010324_10840 [Streptomyces hiroshimensis]|uniref:Transposase n=1 Tax=Streptomyces hiroshimensis TaxID=66424 RepID=A0ABQ2Y7R8_9ACTN|nr:hypothetical protein [Streptomyces hiroshimensis]GGX67380.1 hypothetical protein GCM10010324_10840 [Streptomyces hiroshimensis]